MTISGTMPLPGHCDIGCSADLSCADPAGYVEERETDLGSVRKPGAAGWVNPDDLVRKRKQWQWE